MSCPFTIIAYLHFKILRCCIHLFDMVPINQSEASDQIQVHLNQPIQSALQAFQPWWQPHQWQLQWHPQFKHKPKLHWQPRLRQLPIWPAARAQWPDSNSTKARMGPTYLSIIYPRSLPTMISSRLSIPLVKSFQPRCSLISRPTFPNVLVSWQGVPFRQNQSKRPPTSTPIYFVWDDFFKVFTTYINLFLSLFQALYLMIVHWAPKLRFKPWMAFKSEPNGWKSNWKGPKTLANLTSLQIQKKILMYQQCWRRKKKREKMIGYTWKKKETTYISKKNLVSFLKKKTLQNKK